MRTTIVVIKTWLITVLGSPLIAWILSPPVKGGGGNFFSGYLFSAFSGALFSVPGMVVYHFIYSGASRLHIVGWARCLLLSVVAIFIIFGSIYYFVAIPPITVNDSSFLPATATYAVPFIAGIWQFAYTTPGIDEAIGEQRPIKKELQRYALPMLLLLLVSGLICPVSINFPFAPNGIPLLRLMIFNSVWMVMCVVLLWQQSKWGWVLLQPFLFCWIIKSVVGLLVYVHRLHAPAAAIFTHMRADAYLIVAAGTLIQGYVLYILWSAAFRRYYSMDRRFTMMAMAVSLLAAVGAAVVLR